MDERVLELQVELMRAEAARRMVDSADLSSRAHVQSDSAYLLGLLAFEILLKALIRIHGQEPGNNHKYARLFAMIPPDVQARVKEAAAWARRSGDYTNLDCVLQTLGDNFIDLRYPYEKYGELSKDEYLDRGDQWLAGGAKPEEADYVYYSVELSGLTQGLAAEVDLWIEGRYPESSLAAVEQRLPADNTPPAR